MSATREIVTGYEWARCFPPEWVASFEGEEETGQRGYGPTEQDAIEDLLALYGDDEGPQS